MAPRLDTLSIIRYAAHAVTLAILAGLGARYGGSAVVHIVAAVLIGAGSVSSVPGRSSSFYAGFGLILALAFLTIVSALRAGGTPALLIYTLLLGSAGVWMLLAPTLKSLAFLTIVTALILADSYATWRERHEHPILEPESVARSVTTVSAVLVAGYLEFVAGFLTVAFPVGKAAKSKVGSASGQPKRRRRAAPPLPPANPDDSME